MLDWSQFRGCPVCKAKSGEPCRAQSGHVRGGQTDGVVTPLQRPHFSRARRVARAGRIVPDGFTTDTLGLSADGTMPVVSTAHAELEYAEHEDQHPRDPGCTTGGCPSQCGHPECGA